jgi:hypothetical protein
MRIWPPDISPMAMRRFNGFSVLFWIVMTPVSFITGWSQSVAFVTLLSLWALVMSSMGAWQSSRVEVDMADADVPGEVVEAIVSRTEISEAQEEAREEAAGRDG